MLTLNAQKGLTLLELLISLALGMTAIAGLVSFVGYGIGVNSNVIIKSQLAEETETIMDFMSSEIMRAGYNGDTVALVTDPVANPSLFRNSIAVTAHPSEAANTCITYRYDFDGDGILDTLGVNEEFGFRLRSSQVQIRQSGAACASDVTGSWESISDRENITVDALTFTRTPVLIDGVTRTQIDINIQTQSNTNNRFSANLTRSFIVRNYD